MAHQCVALCFAKKEFKGHGLAFHCLGSVGFCTCNNFSLLSSPTHHNHHSPRTTITTHHKRSRAPRVISAVSQVWTCAVGRRGAKRMQLVCSSVQGAVRALHSCGVRRHCGDDPECYRGSALALSYNCGVEHSRCLHKEMSFASFCLVRIAHV